MSLTLDNDRIAQTSTPISEVLANRFSPRAYDAAAAVDETKLVAALEAARWSPSAANTQPWRFIVARRGTPQFDAIAQAIRTMESVARSGATPIEADKLFHVRVAEATGNSVLVDIVARMFDFRLGPLFDQLHSHFESPEVWSEAIEEHRKILRAIRARNPRLARAAMQEHMKIAYKRLSSSLTRTKRRNDSR